MVEFLKVFDLFINLGREIKNIITAIFRDHSVGVENWNIKIDVADAFIEIIFSELRLVKLFDHLRKHLVKRG